MEIIIPIKIPHSYNSRQNFNVSLIVENVHQCRDTITKQISIGDFVINFPNSFLSR